MNFCCQRLISFNIKTGDLEVECGSSLHTVIKSLVMLQSPVWTPILSSPVFPDVTVALVSSAQFTRTRYFGSVLQEDHDVLIPNIHNEVATFPRIIWHSCLSQAALSQVCSSVTNHRFSSHLWPVEGNVVLSSPDLIWFHQFSVIFNSYVTMEGEICFCRVGNMLKCIY